MRRVKATIEYVGTNYSGFQVQPNAVTVEEVLEERLSKLLKQPINVVASGRTDAGVHALGQVVHFDMDGTFPVDRIAIALNNTLPNDIAMISAVEVASDFHARYSAKRKTYRYKILRTEQDRVFYNDRYYQYSYAVDVSKMRAAADNLIGEHDFKAFMASGSSVKTTVREIYALDIIENGEELYIDITANGFLYNMVRIIVGTLLDIGRGYIGIDSIIAMLDNGERERGGMTAPACGLYLMSVEYV